MTERDIEVRLARIREIGQGIRTEDGDALNAELDDIYRVLSEHRALALPRVVRELEAELAAADANDFFLLDMGRYVAADRMDLAQRAALAIDPKDPIIAQGYTDYFRFAHLLATRDVEGKLLAWLDRTFLIDERSAFLYVHALEVTPMLQGAFLYGLYGAAGERHLLELLKKKDAPRERILDVLPWVGTSACVEPMVKSLERRPTEAMANKFMNVALRVGGPAGMRAVMAFDSKRLPEATAKKWKETLVEVQKLATLADAANQAKAARPTVDVAALEASITEMESHHRLSGVLDVQGMLAAPVATDVVVAWLVRLRASVLHRLSDEALHEAQALTQLINVAQFRDLAR